MSSKQYFEQLPKKLKDFFYKYPPSVKYASKPTSTHALDANPFLFNKHPVTGKYHDPIYSRRRMSDIYKLAHRYGVQEFLPPTDKKFFEEKYENKKFMRGILSPKGHKHENNMEERMRVKAQGIANAQKILEEAKGSKYKRKASQREEKKRVGWV
ncbi:Large ribosomal subunit protein mL59 [Nakaseomyces bracarensis]|uniref:Large ribosomal subunit protein mL59 n=1 Tax=Nakaseomyces bracarensis TaxID=273131 RepID=A0ABR4NWG2_9SACH